MVKNIKDNLTNIVVILGLIASIGAGFTKFAKMESTIEQLSNQTAPDLQGIDDNSFAINDNSQSIASVKANAEKEIAILQKEIEVLKLEIQELKEESKNPLE